VQQGLGVVLASAAFGAGLLPGALSRLAKCAAAVVQQGLVVACASPREKNCRV
jgi:hypothetical protein